jgi:hypothetical protein
VNLGICANSDYCLRQAIGDFIVKLDSDDFLESNYCKQLSLLLEKFPEAGYAHSNIRQIDQDGKWQHDRLLFRKELYMSSDNALIASVKGYRVAANIIMFRKTALESVNYLTGRPVHFAEDYHLSVDLAVNGWGNVFNDQLLANYRVWNDADNVRAKRKLVEINGLAIIFFELLFPAFYMRKWKNNILILQLENIACTHSNCLGWNEYNLNEKKEIETALLNLSNSKKVNLYMWLYKNKIGGILLFFNNFLFYLKYFIKKNILYVKKNNI